MKIKKNFINLLLCLALSACTLATSGSQVGVVTGSGHVVTETRTVTGVERVMLSNQGDLTILIGPEVSLLIEAEDNLVPYIETNVRTGTLEISTQDGVDIRNTKPIQYTLTVNELKGLTISSSGNIGAGSVTTGSFKIQVSSSGNTLIGELNADSLEVNISSSGVVNINGGQVADLQVKISSSGDLKMEDVEVQNADIDISSSGSAYIWVTGALGGRISSSGNIYYAGDPQQVEVSVSSSGKAIPR
jgi:hypothetical protein